MLRFVLVICVVLCLAFPGCVSSGRSDAIFITKPYPLDSSALEQVGHVGVAPSGHKVSFGNSISGAASQTAVLVRVGAAATKYKLPLYWSYKIVRGPIHEPPVVYPGPDGTARVTQWAKSDRDFASCVITLSWWTSSTLDPDSGQFMKVPHGELWEFGAEDWETQYGAAWEDDFGKGIPIPKP